LDVTHRFRNIVRIWAIVLIGLVHFAFGAQKSQPSAAAKSAGSEAARWRIWKSTTSGKEYRVRVEKDVFYAEWVNIPLETAKHGAYIRTECRRAGAKWIGTSRVFLPCAKPGEAKGKTTNVCPMTVRFEVDSITPQKITGGGETLRDFDCEKCEVRQTGWGSFVWVPKH
jgi:hypothetical protein